MQYRQTAIDVLRHAEEGLKSAIQQAVTAEDYPAVDELNSWVKTIKSLHSYATTAAPVALVSDVRSLPVAHASDGRPLPPGIAAARNKAKQYPKFFRQGDQLVKVGWSKKEREEYIHKAPYTSVLATANSIQKAATGKKVFSADKFFPVLSADGQAELPGYQAYLSLAWFRTLGLVDQKGRQGYMLKTAEPLAVQIEASWKTLEELA